MTQPLQQLPDNNQSQEYRELHLAVQQLLTTQTSTSGVGFNYAVASLTMRVKLLESVAADAALHISANGEARLATAADTTRFCNGFASTTGATGTYIVALLSGSLVTASGQWLSTQFGVTTPIALTGLPAKQAQWLGHQVSANKLLFQFTPPTKL